MNRSGFLVEKCCRQLVWSPYHPAPAGGRDLFRRSPAIRRGLERHFAGEREGCTRRHRDRRPSRTIHVDPRTALPLEDAEQIAEGRAGDPGAVAAVSCVFLRESPRGATPWSCCALKWSEWVESRLAQRGCYASRVEAYRRGRCARDHWRGGRRPGRARPGCKHDGRSVQVQLSLGQRGRLSNRLRADECREGADHETPVGFAQRTL